MTTDQPAKPINLDDFLDKHLDVLDIQAMAIKNMLPAASSFPRVVTLVQHSKQTWGLAGVFPATPHLFPTGGGSVRLLLKANPQPTRPTVNVLIVVLKNPNKENEYASLAIVGNIAGDIRVIGSHADKKWAPLADMDAAEKIIGALLSEETPTPKFLKFREAIIEFLEKSKEFKDVEPIEMAEALIVLAQAFPLSSMHDLMEELHVGALHVLQHSVNAQGDVQGALERAKKAHEKQYQRLLKDHEKLEMQLLGYKSRIQRLEAELKRLGQLRNSNAPVATTYAGQSLSNRLDALF